MAVVDRGTWFARFATMSGQIAEVSSSTTPCSARNSSTSQEGTPEWRCQRIATTVAVATRRQPKPPPEGPAAQYEPDGRARTTKMAASASESACGKQTRIPNRPLQSVHVAGNHE
jgi:hypothetical protein